MSEMNQIPQHHDTGKCAADIFLLTKPPQHERARLCRKLIAQSENAIIYLAGDGVYNILGSATQEFQKEIVLACKKDLEAGVYRWKIG